MHRERASRFVSQLTRDTIAFVLAGGRGAGLKHLTAWRALPALPFAGKLRIIDFPLSNCINSGIRRIAVLAQYRSQSLIRHVHKGWGFLKGEFSEFVEVLPASQCSETPWYSGTADAVFQNLDTIRIQRPKYVLILAADQVYKMDYGPLLGHHVRSGADVTVATIEVPIAQARDFGVVRVEEDQRITRFREKPAQPELISGRDDVALASMGIYVFNADFLCEELAKDSDNPGSSHDFGKDVIPSLVRDCRVVAFPFPEARVGDKPYWRHVGTIDAYWEANMELIDIVPDLDLYDEAWPIWTYQEQLPPAKFVFDDDDRRGTAIDSMLSGGCIISGSHVYRSLLFSDVKVNSYSTLHDTVVLPDVEIGRHCRIRKAVIDRACDIPPNTVIGEDHDQDARRFYVSEGGVVVVTPEMLGQEIHRFRHTRTATAAAAD